MIASWWPGTPPFPRLFRKQRKTFLVSLHFLNFIIHNCIHWISFLVNTAGNTGQGKAPKRCPFVEWIISQAFIFSFIPKDTQTAQTSMLKSQSNYALPTEFHRVSQSFRDSRIVRASGRPPVLIECVISNRNKPLSIFWCRSISGDYLAYKI